MHFKTWLNQYRGIILIAIAAVATIWLGVTDKLGLYIHPRYYLFSITACGLGLLAIIWAFGSNNQRSLKDSKINYVALFIILFSVVNMLVIKPSTLSSDIASQRGVNSASNTDTIKKLYNSDVESPFRNTSFSQLTVKDWANLLAQTNDQNYFKGKDAVVSGFITKDERDPKNRFFVSRFIVSCCAVDARPIGVPVYLPDWNNKYSSDEWIMVEGEFTISDNIAALDNPKIKRIDIPKDPYVY